MNLQFGRDKEYRNIGDTVVENLRNENLSSLPLREELQKELNLIKIR